jgi:hypothetical protein
MRIRLQRRVQNKTSDIIRSEYYAFRFERHIGILNGVLKTLLVGHQSHVLQVYTFSVRWSLPDINKMIRQNCNTNQTRSCM